MQFFKKLGRGGSALLFKIALFALALAASFNAVLGTPDGLKQGLKESKIYSSIVDNAIDTFQKELQKKPQAEGEDLPLDHPEIQIAIKTAFTPVLLQDSTEQIIDSTYEWLGGKTPEPDFRIDLAPAKQKLAESLGNYAVARAKTLPACNLQQTRALQGQPIDPLNASCLPPGFNPESLRTEMVNQINNDEHFLKETVITAKTLKNDQGESPFDKFSQAPKAFSLARSLPYILGGLAIISGLGLVLLHDERRRGLRQIGIITFGTGIFLLVTTILLDFLFKQANKPGSPINNIAEQSFRQTIAALFKSLSSALNGKLIIFAVVYTIIGGGILLALKFTAKKVPKTEGKGLVDDHAATTEQPSLPETKQSKDSKPEDKSPKPE